MRSAPRTTSVTRLLCIVDDDRELIRVPAIGAHVSRNRRPRARDLARCGPGSRRRIRSRARARAAPRRRARVIARCNARARMHTIERRQDRCGCTSTHKRIQVRLQSVERILVRRASAGSGKWRLVGLHAECGQRRQDVRVGAGTSRGGSRSSTRTIHAATGRARDQPAAERRDERAEMQRPVGEGAKRPRWARAGLGMGPCDRVVSRARTIEGSNHEGHDEPKERGISRLILHVPCRSISWRTVPCPRSRQW